MLQKKISKKAFLILSFTMMALVLGCRGDSVGEDTIHFSEIYQYISVLKWKTILKSGYWVVYNTLHWYGSSVTYQETIEIGYAVLNKFISMFTSNPHAVHFIVASLTCYYMGRFVYYNAGEFLFLGTMVFMCESLYMNSFNLSRQMLAVALVLNTVQLLQEKKYKRMVALYVVAVLIHMSSFIMLLLIPLYLFQKKYYRNTIEVVVACSVVVSVALPILGTKIGEIVPKYEKYFKTSYWDVDINGTMIIWALGIVICIMAYVNLKTLDKNMFIAVCCFILYLLFDIISMRLASFSRIALFFRGYLIVLLPAGGRYFKYRNAYNACLMVLLVAEFMSYASSASRVYSVFWH